jgi:hypothetical protein
VRDLDDVGKELRLVAAVRAAVLELGGKPTTAAADQLLDEMLDSRTAAGPVSTEQ